MTDRNETADEQLERRYRRLLRAYPSWYRKARGEEMLTTLLDASEGRDRPTAGQRIDIMFGGLRKHLAVGTIPAAMFGVLMALLIATFGAVGGAVLGWQTAADLPDDAAADRIAAQAVPDIGTVAWSARSLFQGSDMEGDPITDVINLRDWDEYGAGSLWYELDHPDDHYARLDAAKTRLTADGWHVTPLPIDYGKAFTATRSDLTLEVSTDKYSPSQTTISIYRTTPTLVPVLTVAGLIIGGLVGWFATSRAFRRASGWQETQRIVAASLLGGGMTVLALPTGICLYCIALSLIDPAARVPIWIGFIWSPASLITMAGVGLVVSSLLCGFIPVRRRVTPIAHLGTD